MDYKLYSDVHNWTADRGVVPLQPTGGACERRKPRNRTPVLVCPLHRQLKCSARPRIGAEREAAVLIGGAKTEDPALLLHKSVKDRGGRTTRYHIVVDVRRGVNWGGIILPGNHHVHGGRHDAKALPHSSVAGPVQQR